MDEGLRGFDAVHLASAIALRDGLGTDVVFAAFDPQLWRAAERSHFATFRPTCLHFSPDRNDCA